MLSFEVVVGEVGTDLFQGCPMVFIFGHFQLGLDGSEARFHEGVVVAVACTAHALTHLSAPQHGAVFLACVLSATIGVMNQYEGLGLRVRIAIVSAASTKASVISSPNCQPTILRECRSIKVAK